jgi:hypothetical protein
VPDLYVIVHTSHSYRPPREQVYDVNTDESLPDVTERAAELERDAHRAGRKKDTYRVARLAFTGAGTDVEPRSPIIPAQGPHRPAVVSARLIAPVLAIDTASQTLGDFYGDLWQEGGRGKSRKNPADVLLYGSLIVPIPTR